MRREIGTYLVEQAASISVWNRSKVGRQMRRCCELLVPSGQPRRTPLIGEPIQPRLQRRVQRGLPSRW
jgi:hypothetical protein